MEIKEDKIKRLELLIRENGGTQTAFAAKLGIKQQNISDMLRGNRAIGKNFINSLYIAFGVNPEWMETGEGEMFLDGNGVKYTADIAIKALQEEISLLKAELGECRRLAESHIAIINSLAEQNKSLTMLLQKNEMAQKITENV